jgi:hypothetical protein
MEEEKMKKIAALLFISLFVISLSISGPDTLFASEEEEYKGILLQDEEQDSPSDEDYERMMKEVEDSEEEKEQTDEEEKDYPDEKYQDDRG